jgi:hypothetical protein
VDRGRPLAPVLRSASPFPNSQPFIIMVLPIINIILGAAVLYLAYAAGSLPL